MAGYVRDDALVSAELTLLDGTACRADFLGSAIALGYEGGYGMAAAMGMWGIIAPADMYDDVVAQLAPCVGTLTFSDEYVAQCNAANDAITAAALDRSAANNAVTRRCRTLTTTSWIATALRSPTVPSSSFNVKQFLALNRVGGTRGAIRPWRPAGFSAC